VGGIVDFGKGVVENVVVVLFFKCPWGGQPRKLCGDGNGNQCHEQRVSVGIPSEGQEKAQITARRSDLGPGWRAMIPTGFVMRQGFTCECGQDTT